MASKALKYLTFMQQINLQSIASRDRRFIFEEIREQTGSSLLLTILISNADGVVDYINFYLSYATSKLFQIHR